MALDFSSMLRREQALADARRRLALLEIETHRIKAELARLEADNESEWAEELAADLRAAPAPSAPAHTNSGFPATPATTASQSTAAVRADLAPERKSAACSAAPPSIQVAAAKGRAAPKRGRKRLSPAWWVSLALHAAVLAVLAPMTYVILTNESVPLFASMYDVEPSQLDPGITPVEMVAEEELTIQEASFDDASQPLAESLSHDLTPLAAAVNDFTPTPGQLNNLPTDLGTLMAGDGDGEAAGGRRGGDADMVGAMGRTSFFGTPARANRVVFLVDNSGSMKQGRMETTLYELARSVEALGEKQEFYVVFYSDRAYPMLYPNSVMEPLAATNENKQRLYDWLQTVELCNGGALLKAMEIAESLQPHVVYILSDGDITGTTTMQRLTQTNERPFAIHTLGMGVAKPQDAQNLAAIAQANRGTFQMVRPLPAAVQSAKLRPIRSNPRGVAWGQGL